MRGKFITFEGGDGSGKSTQARRLAEHLSQTGREAVLTREPGGSPLAERLRHLILDPATPRHSALAEALMFSAARADHLDATIRPALARGAWVISDRFADSTRVYQGLAGGLAIETVDVLERMVVGDTVPDLTLLLDLDPVVGLARASRRRAGSGAEADAASDGFEAREAAFHRRLRDGFLALARSVPQRIVVLDATRPPDDLAGDVVRTVIQRFGGG